MDAKNKQNLSQRGGFFSGIRLGESYVSLLLGALVVVIAAVLGFFYVKLHQSNQPRQELLPPAQIVRQLKLTTQPATPSSTISPTVYIASPTPSKSKNQIATSTPKVQKQTSVTPTPTPSQHTQLTKTYIVRKDDNLWTISVKEYKSGYNWVSIAQANHLANPGNIFSGDTLIIPSVSPIVPQNNLSIMITQPATPSAMPVKPTTVTPVPNISITATTYTVQKGDTLWDIAVRAYGDGYKWPTIAKANNLANPSIIHSGNVLKIPKMQTL